ncbi:hypothetical protein IRJ41_024700 [Triplophysa rosa]|uniref:Uncharacterized protein n=1 Tax=Triplophysa rosa TaxID=992332 RepID=A0A9W7X7E8_TRIRA|nr:hypothetical protein IRJ41_024700 [Triplophysa rosa]
MAPFTISPHHSLSYQCHLPPTAPYQQSKMSVELSSNTTGTPEDRPLSAYRRMSVSSMLLKIRLHLWQVIQRVQNCFMSVIELFGSNMFLFICVGKNTAMTGELKKNSVVEAQERPGVEFMSGMLRSVELDKQIQDSEMELDDEGLTTPAERQEWSMDDSEEEDECQLSEWESEEDDDDEEEEEEDGEEEQTRHEETECDVDSEWSDDDDDEDSEASTESLELWESFFKSSDPYNPLSFSSCTASRTNTSSTSKNQLTPSSEIKQATNEEEHYPKPSTKKGKKVKISC